MSLLFFSLIMLAYIVLYCNRHIRKKCICFSRYSCIAYNLVSYTYVLIKQIYLPKKYIYTCIIHTYIYLTLRFNNKKIKKRDIYLKISDFDRILSRTKNIWIYRSFYTSSSKPTMYWSFLSVIANCKAFVSR